MTRKRRTLWQSLAMTWLIVATALMGAACSGVEQVETSAPMAVIASGNSSGNVSGG